MFRKALAVLILTALGAVPLFAADGQDKGAAAPAGAAADTRTNTEKLSDPDPVVRRNAVIYLGAERKKENFPAISGMLQDADAEVRRSAVNALASSGDARAAAALIERFKSEGNTNVKINIVAALGELRSKTAIGMLKNVLKDSYPAFRNEAVRALGKINDPATYPQITAMLSDEAEGVRVIACDTVARLKIYSAAPELQANLENRVGVVRRAAADALGVVGTTASLEKLQKLLADTDESVARAAQAAMDKIQKRASSGGAGQQQAGKEPAPKPGAK